MDDGTPAATDETLTSDRTDTKIGESFAETHIDDVMKVSIGDGVVMLLSLLMMMRKEMRGRGLSHGYKKQVIPRTRIIMIPGLIFLLPVTLLDTREPRKSTTSATR